MGLWACPMKQIGKLEEVLGQLVAEKHGKGIRGERGSHVINES